MSLLSLEEHLATYFQPRSRSSTPSIASIALGIRDGRFSESAIENIRRLLNIYNAAWARAPRTYITLRLADELLLMDPLINAGFTDYKFPLGYPKDLPSFVKPQSKRKIMKAQHAILTKAIELERGKEDSHVCFDMDEPLPYETRAILGAGAFGQVDKVLSKISYKEYARKVIARRALFPTASDTIRIFVNELTSLKRVRHRHIVTLVGSYTDVNYYGLIIEPVADCNLATYLQLAYSSSDCKSLLRSFFGCLATGLAYLHDCDIRHKDIKPHNILVKHSSVLFTDFGLARDSTDASNSISVGTTGLSPAYCAPEVAAYEPRRSSSDVWSLGCVFFDMITVLKGHTVEDMQSFLMTHGSLGIYLRTNRAAYNEWKYLLSAASEVDNLPMLWISLMLQEEAASRPTAQEIVDQIIAPEQSLPCQAQFCGICCRLDPEPVTSAPSAEEHQRSRYETDRVGSVECYLATPVQVNSRLRQRRNGKGQRKIPLLGRRSNRRKEIPNARDTDVKKKLATCWFWRAAKRDDLQMIKHLIDKDVAVNHSELGVTSLH